MLIIVIENPIQFTIVKDVPIVSPGALRATRVENMGESAITTSPQNIRKVTRTITELLNKISGEIIQQMKDKNNAAVATFFAP